MTTTTEPRSDFAGLMAGVQAGDADAARRLYEKYGGYILKAVRRRLAARMRSQFDSMDFAQDVWASFFTNAMAQYDLNDPGQLIALLTTMARNKVIEAVRKRVQAQNNAHIREDSLNEQVDGGVHVPSPQQTPSQILMGQEEWDALLASQPPVYRLILLLLRSGKSHETIAQELKVSIRTVRRVATKFDFSS